MQKPVQPVMPTQQSPLIQPGKPSIWSAPKLQSWFARLLVGVLVVALAAALWFTLPITAGLLLQHLAERAGLNNPQFAVRQVGLKQAELAQVQFALDTGAGPAEISLAQLRFSYTLSKPALDSLEIGRATMKWRQAASEKTKRPSPPIRMPFSSLSIAQLDLEAETSLGRSVFSGKANINRRQDGSWEALFNDPEQSVRATLAPSGTEAKVVVNPVVGSKILELAVQGLDKARIHATLHAEAKALLEWLLASALVPGTIHSAVASFPAFSAGLRKAEPRLQVVAEAVTGDGPPTLSGRLLQQDKPLLTADVRLAGSGSLGIVAQVDAPVPLLLDLAMPLLPANLEQLQPRAGDVKGKATLGWQKNSWTGTAELKATGLAMTVGLFQIENAGLSLRLADVRNGTAELSAGIPSLLLSGILANDLAIRATYRPGELALEQARTSVLGGTLELAPATIDLQQRPVAVTLRVQAVDLSRLLESLQQEGLSGTGTISGEIPLWIADDSLEIRDGQLAGTTSGVLRYRGPVPDADNIAFRALNDLVYQTLQATVNYRPNGDYRIGLRLEGRNPALLEGHPLALNLNLTGQLPALLRASLLSGDFNRPLLEHIEHESTGQLGGQASSFTPSAKSYKKPPRAARRDP